MSVVLNVGCGDWHLPNAVNIDVRDDVNADLVCDVRHLPYETGSVDRIVALDILEHFRQDEIEQVLLEWRRVLRPGGRLTVKVPNMDRLARMIVNGEAVTAAIRNIYGGHRFGPDGAWDCHHTGWTPLLLAETLEHYGFEVRGQDGAINMTMEACRDDNR